MTGQVTQVTASVSGQYINPAAEGDGQADDSRAPVSETQVGCVPG